MSKKASAKSPISQVVSALTSPPPTPKQVPKRNKQHKNGRASKQQQGVTSKGAPAGKAVQEKMAVKSEALTKVDVGSMAPSEYGTQLSYPDLINLIDAIIGQYAMCTGIFCNDNGDQVPATNPSSMAQYMIGLVMTWISENGNLGGSNKNDVAPNPSDLAVPCALAKFMEYLAPVEEDGAKLITTFSLNFNVSTSQCSYPDNQLLGNYRNSNFPNIQYNSQYLDNQYGEYRAFNTGVVVGLADLWSNNARQISQEIRQCKEFLSVSYKDIPRTAPNASAHTVWIDPLTRVTGALIPVPTNQLVAKNIFRNYDVEESLIFSSFSTRPAPLNPITKPIPSIAQIPSLDVSASGTEVAIAPAVSAAYAFSFLAARQLTYPTGTILGKKGIGLRVKDQRVTTLNISYQVLTPSSIAQIINSMTRSALDQTNVSWTNQEYENYRALTAVLVHTLVQLRVNLSSPFHYLSNTDQSKTFFAPQAYFVDRAWASESVPALLQKFIDSLGHVLASGGLIVPYLPQPNNEQRGFSPITNAQTLPVGTLRLLLWAGIETTTGRALDPSYRSIPASQITPTIYVNGQLYTYTVAASQYGSTDTTGFTTRFTNNFVNGTKFDLMNQWRGILQAHCNGASFNDSYIQSRNEEYGRCSAMVTTCIAGRNAATHELFPVNNDDNSYQYTFLVFEVAVFGGPVALPSPCMVDAITHAVSFYPDGDSRNNQGKMSLQVPSGANTSSYLVTFSQRTFAPDSALGQAMAAGRARASRRSTIQVGTTRLPAAADVKDWATPALERVTNTMADTLYAATKVIMPNVASFLGGPAAGHIVNCALNTAVNALSSWTGIASGDPAHPTRNMLQSARAPALQAITAR